MGENGVSRNFLHGMARAVVCVAVLWVAMHFFFAWQDGVTPSGPNDATKVIPTVTSR